MTRKITLAVLTILMIVAVSWGHRAIGSPIKVVGKVAAVDLSANPQTLVINTTGAKGRALTVGCRVTDKTKFESGKHRGTLKDFKPGNMARLTYFRDQNGLVCERIVKQ